MIIVSDNFKEAIKSDERRMIAWSELVPTQYNKFSNLDTIEETHRQTSSITPHDMQFGLPRFMYDDDRYSYNYALVDGNFKLDGSVYLADERRTMPWESDFYNPCMRYYSNWIYNQGKFNYNDGTQINYLDIDLKLIENESPEALTIYFADGHPNNFDILMYDNLYVETLEQAFDSKRDFSSSELKIKFNEDGHVLYIPEENRNVIMLMTDTGYTIKYTTVYDYHGYGEFRISLYNKKSVETNLFKYSVYYNEEREEVSKYEYITKLPDDFGTITGINVDDDSFNYMLEFISGKNNGDIIKITEEDEDKFQLDMFFLNLKNSPKRYSFKNLTLRLYDYNIDDVRPSIMELDLIATRVYSDDRLITMKVNESVDKFNRETPVNSVSIEFVAGEDYEVLNENGIVSFLGQDYKIRNYIGLLTDKGNEFVTVGNYFVESWINNHDGTGTINSLGIMNNFAKEQVMSKTYDYQNGLVADENAFYNWLNITYSNFDIPYINYQFDFDFNYTYADEAVYLPYDLKVLNLLQYKCLMFNATIREARDNFICLYRVNKPSQGRLEYNQYQEDPQIEKIDKINRITIEMSRTDFDITSPWDKQEVACVSQSFICYQNGENYFKVKGNKTLLRCYASNNKGKNMEIMTDLMDGHNDSVNYAIVCIYDGIKGEEIEISMHDPRGNQKVLSSSKVTTYTYTYDRIDNENKITEMKIKSPQLIESGDTELYANQILDLTSSLKVKLLTFGDPSIEAGDCIDVATEYGYKKIFVTNIQMLYDGGLTEVIEGEVIE